MMSVTCHNLEIGRTPLESLACGCSFSKGVLRNVSRRFSGKKLLSCRQEFGRISTKASLTGI